MKVLALTLALTAMGAVPLFAQTAATPPTPVITTSGEGVVKRAPDRAWVMIAAESRARSAQDAQRMNTDAMTAVVDRIKSTGIPAEAIRTAGYNLQPEFDYASGKQSLRGYVARNQVEVRIDALPKTGDVIAAAVGTGATNVSGMRFDLKDRQSAEQEALRLAVRDARARADAAASGAGVQIERIMRIDEQREVDDIRPMAGVAMMRAEAPAQPVPIEAGEIEIRARVTLTAAIR
jgi:uncharacterized protein